MTLAAVWQLFGGCIGAGLCLGAVVAVVNSWRV